MDKRTPILCLISVASLSAQERWSASLLIGRLTPRSAVVTDNVFFKDVWEADPVTTLGLRLGVGLPSIASADVQLQATYLPKAKSDLRMVETDPEGRYPDTFKATYGYSYLGIGAAFTWRMPMDIGMGLELRSEKVEFSGGGLHPEEGALTRPWLEVHGGYTWWAAKAKPFIRIEFAFPLTRTSAPDWRNVSASALIKSTAPQSHIQIASGFRW